MRLKHLLTISAILAISTAVPAPAKAQAPQAAAPAVPGLTLTSPAFEDGPLFRRSSPSRSPILFHPSFNGPTFLRIRSASF